MDRILESFRRSSMLIAIVAAPLAYLVLMCLPGTGGPNRFGPDPKADSLADIFA